MVATQYSAIPTRKLLPLFVSALLLLSACAEQPYQRSPVEWPVEGSESPEPVTPAEPSSSVPTPQPEQQSSGAVDLLLRAASAELRAGKTVAAVGTLERALRIAPANASVYLALAEVYLDRGDSELAKNIAGRGLLYCESRRQCSELERIAH
ncbi:MAG: tetratricopeptide (TPR) repeat protein [Halieaceae bacterium]|jgi:tetratricopeptide (TPR) repeat protein